MHRLPILSHGYATLRNPGSSSAGLGLGVALLISLGSAAGAAEIRALSDRLVPAPLVWAFDVRWDSASSVLITAGQMGIFEVLTDTPDQPPRQVTPRNGEPGGFWLSTRLGSSPTNLVTGAPGRSYYTTTRSKYEPRQEVLDTIADLDLFGDQLLILGSWRDENGAYTPDGAIAWLGPVGAGQKGLRPVLYSSYGPGARGMGECGNLGLSGARFLADGSFVLVPGVEPGIFWYSKSGELQRTWESSAIGLEDECKPMLGITGPIRIDPHAQNQWLGQRRVVDEILPLAAGPGIIIRERHGAEIHWRMAMLTIDGKVSWLDLPLKGSSTYSHLKGDVRGSRIVFLVVEHGKEIQKPAAVPRIVLAELTE